MGPTLSFALIFACLLSFSTLAVPTSSRAAPADSVSIAKAQPDEGCQPKSKAFPGGCSLPACQAVCLPAAVPLTGPGRLAAPLYMTSGPVLTGYTEILATPPPRFTPAILV